MTAKEKYEKSKDNEAKLKFLRFVMKIHRDLGVWVDPKLWPKP